MKRSIIAVVTIMAVASLYGAIGCTESGTESGTESETSDAGVEDVAEVASAAEPSYTSAMDSLAAGDIASARDEFAAIIDSASASAQALSSAGKIKTVDLESIIPQSHFGRALTNILLLMESEPATSILAGLGQGPWNTESVFGAAGLLARMNEIYSAEDINVTYSGAESGAFADSYAVTTGESGAAVSWGFQSSGVDSKAEKSSTSGKVLLMIGVNSDFQATATTTTLSGTCDVNVGDSITSADICTITPVSIDIPMLSVYVTGLGGYNYYSGNASGGSVTINQLGSAEGEAFSVTFNDLVLDQFYSAKTITLSGTYEDKITKRKASLDGLGLPFASICEKAGCILSQVAESYHSNNLIASLAALQPLLDSIVSDLEAATASEGIAFEIPKGLFFGSSNLMVSHADMMLMLGGVYMAKAAINLAHSWTCEIPLYDMFDTDGTLIVSKSQIVDKLNEFFQLKGTNELGEAQVNLLNAFGALLRGFQEVMDGAAGVVTMNSESAPFFSEVHAMFTSANQSLSGMTPISGLVPPVSADLAALLSGGVNGEEISFDPFVLEGAAPHQKIKPVEAYFIELIQNVTDYDLAAGTDVDVFSSAVKHPQTLVDNILQHLLLDNRVGGK